MPVFADLFLPPDLAFRPLFLSIKTIYRRFDPHPSAPAALQIGEPLSLTDVRPSASAR